MEFPDLGHEEFEIFKKLSTPAKVQDYLDAFPINFEKSGETYRSPLITIRRNEAHCMEGAMLAASIFWYHGEAPLVMNLQTTRDDVGHVVALFRRGGKWGAVSKTNHAVLRYRDPVYATARELAMSYFNEYFLDSGKKTLRSFSEPFDLRTYGTEWLASRKHLWNIVYGLMDSKHTDIIGSKEAKYLRPADQIEIQAGKITEWKRKAAAIADK